MNRDTIVIVDDEPSIVKMLQLVLQKEGFQHIYTAGTCREALDTIAKHGANIVLLDVMLPDGSGFELCSQIRQLGNPHILFLTAKASDLDVLTGFALGGDDYITKPFNPLEIAARIKARLRRRDESGQAPGASSLFTAAAQPIFRFGRFQVNEAAGELLVDGQPVSCPAQVFQLLLFFCKNPGIVFSKGQLYEAVWGIDGIGDDNTVMVHIRRIRERIEHDPSMPTHLLTVRGLGYKLAKDPTGL
ncbi:response regulator transcription factor [Paenibacillus paridis]|uniref:response regulator transcription factor n=1 Tax=Paenibacillus paridis TaxID=2583376 RepID=UPI001120A333|nr:response regulator transcription factor [Paenibacillus paridis]